MTATRATAVLAILAVAAATLGAFYGNNYHLLIIGSIAISAIVATGLNVLFGLAGQSVLSYLTWETAKIRATQSATGILFVDFFTVVVGEVLAKYIVLATHVPV